MTAPKHYNESMKQRPFQVRKTLKDILQKPKVHRQANVILPLPSLPPHDHTREEYIYDIVYECQRGSWIIGYSSKTLLQFDPHPWCDSDMRYTPMDTTTYQLPDPTWEWASKQWMVDMTDDVDEVFIFSWMAICT
ncbi:hypothetical protein BDF14DRAFT_1850860 [Spinellus fusiger]|nr:hypothetical protein BDF14DRAFT_1850860 [Spinellus fusiger]